MDSGLSDLISCLLHTSHTGSFLFLKEFPATGPLHFLLPLPVGMSPNRNVACSSTAASAQMSPSDHLAFIFLHSPYLTFDLHNMTCMYLVTVSQTQISSYLFSIFKESSSMGTLVPFFFFFSLSPPEPRTCLAHIIPLTKQIKHNSL